MPACSADCPSKYSHCTVRAMVAVSGLPTPLSALQVYTPPCSRVTLASVRQLLLGHVRWELAGTPPSCATEQRFRTNILYQQFLTRYKAVMLLKSKLVAMVLLKLRTR